MHLFSRVCLLALAWPLLAPEEVLGGSPGTVVAYVDQLSGTVHFILDVSGYFR